MINFRLVVLAILVVLGTFSCGKDKNSEDNGGSTALVGSVWAQRSSASSYNILKFKDAKNVEWITKTSSSSPEATSSLTYTVSGSTVTIPDGAITWSGEIGESRLDLRPDVGSNFITFFKE